MHKLDTALAKLHNYVQEKNLFPAGAKLLLCCSGGADSVALVQLFSKLRSLMHITLLAVHVDHQLRGKESDADAEMVKNMCLQLNIPVIVRKIKLEGRQDLENRARTKRFAIFYQLLELYRFDFIVTAHHNNDQAETMLMNLFRGAGLNGMAGIKPSSGMVLHPLLSFNKQELVDLLLEEKVTWCEDSTNQDASYRRNWIRNFLLPLLQKEINPSLGDKLGLQAQIFLEAEELLRQKTKSLLKKAVLEQTPEGTVLALPVLQKYTRLEQYYVLKTVVSEVSGSERDFFLHNFEDICELMNSEGSKYIRLSHDLLVRKQYRELSISTSTGAAAIPEPYAVEEDRSRAVYGDYRFSFKLLKVLPAHREEDAFSVYLDADKIRFPFTIRSRQPGDRFQPTGMTGFQKVKDYFINNKVPKFERDLVPLFDDGEKIFWIAGYRLDERVCIDENSVRFLHVITERVHAKPMRAANRNKKTGENSESDEL